MSRNGASHGKAAGETQPNQPDTVQCLRPVCVGKRAMEEPASCSRTPNRGAGACGARHVRRFRVIVLSCFPIRCPPNQANYDLKPLFFTVIKICYSLPFTPGVCMTALLHPLLRYRVKTSCIFRFPEREHHCALCLTKPSTQDTFDRGRCVQ